MEREIPDCRTIDWSVPIRSSEWSGTGIVMVDSGIRFCITIWLPRRRTSLKPCCSSKRQTSLPDRMRNLANSHLKSGDEDFFVHSGFDFIRICYFKEQFKSFLQIFWSSTVRWGYCILISPKIKNWNINIPLRNS